MQVSVDDSVDGCQVGVAGHDCSFLGGLELSVVRLRQAFGFSFGLVFVGAVGEEKVALFF